MSRIAILLLMVSTTSAMPPVPRVVLPDLAPSGAEELKDIQALADRIASNSKSVSEKLADEKTDREMLRDQKQVRDDLDALIKLLDQPPPPSSSSTSSSSPNSPQGEPSKQNDKGSPDSKEQGKKNQSPSGAPMPKGKEQPGPAKPESAKGSESSMGTAAAKPGQSGGLSSPGLPPEESLARDFWGHLPDTSRQQMMQFYREQYMTKYKGLLAQYYQSLADKEKKGAK